MSVFVVRPSNTEKDAFRVRLTGASLVGLNLRPGDLCTIRREPDGQTQQQERPGGLPNGNHNYEQTAAVTPQSCYAIAWDNSGAGMKDNIVQTSKFVQELYGLKLGDRVIIERAGEALQNADVVRLRPVMTDKPVNTLLDDEFWTQHARGTIRLRHEYLANGQKLPLKFDVETKEFEVVDPGGGGGMGIARVTGRTTVVISDGPSAGTISTNVEFRPTRIGGAKTQTNHIKKLINDLLRPKHHMEPVQGLLLYGAKGVGKSLFIEELSKSGWNNVVRWQPGFKLSSTSWNESTLIIVGQLDLPEAQGGSKAHVREIDELFRTIKGKPCFVVTEARHPNNVHEYLRSFGRFEEELEIPIPSAVQRCEILAVMGQDAVDQSSITSIAEKTHGYVGQDLYRLLRKTVAAAGKRKQQNGEPGAPQTDSGEKYFDATEASPYPSESDAPIDTTETIAIIPPLPAAQTLSTIHPQDLATALTQIRPSALQEIFLETPSTRWSDIGGQSLPKRLLMSAVTRPLRDAERMAALNLRPKKGVLLYGPPGCSKTLLVRALANEAGLNFLAVKGAELISMYVGESERATREIFRKARAAAPSIVFFDEVDAIASARSIDGAASSGSKDLNVLTTLLNELDGFESLSGVFVVAATNSPQTLDPALLRPGRFDNVVYIPPPDLEARKEIFARQFAASSYKSTARGVEEDVWYFAGKTEGYSGAEVVGICERAKEGALEQDRGEWRFGDVEEALAGMPRGLSLGVLRAFEDWGEGRMGTGRALGA